MAARNLVGEHGAAHVDGEHEIPILHAHLAGIRGTVNGRRMSQRIQAAQLLHRLAKGLLHARLVRNINVQVARRARSLRTRLGGHRSALLIKHIHADHVRAPL